MLHSMFHVHCMHGLTPQGGAGSLVPNYTFSRGQTVSSFWFPCQDNWNLSGYNTSTTFEMKRKTFFVETLDILLLLPRYELNNKQPYTWTIFVTTIQTNVILSKYTNKITFQTKQLGWRFNTVLYCYITNMIIARYFHLKYCIYFALTLNKKSYNVL